MDKQRLEPEEPITPELALVAPDLAARARASLPPPGYPFWRDRPERPSVQDSASSRPPPEAPQAHVTVLGAARWAWGRVGASLVTFGAVVILSMVLFVVGSHPGPTLESTVTAAGSTLVESKPAVQRISWPAEAAAAFYDVQVYRVRKKVFEAWPTRPTVDIALANLAAGSYIVYVWPALHSTSGTRYGALSVTRSFVVKRPPAT